MHRNDHEDDEGKRGCSRKQADQQQEAADKFGQCDEREPENPRAVSESVEQRDELLEA